MNFLGVSQDFNIPQGLALTGKAFFHGRTACKPVLKRP